MWDDLLIDGTSPWTDTMYFTDWAGVLATADQTGDNYSTPGRPGVTWQQKQLAAGSITLPVEILPAPSAMGSYQARQGSIQAQWTALLSACAPRRRTVGLTRRQTIGTAKVAQTAIAELAGSLAPTYDAGFNCARCTLTFRILHGCWFASTMHSVTIRGNDTPVHIHMGGNVDTHRITLTFKGGQNQKLINRDAAVSTINPDGTDDDVEDVWVAHDKDLRNGGQVILDCDKFTAVTQNDENILTHISHGGDSYWMVLDPGISVSDSKPGVNSLRLTGGGTCEIQWREAYR